VAGLQKKCKQLEFRNININCFFFQMPVYAYFDSKTNPSLDFWSLSIRRISDDPRVLTQGIFGLNLVFLLNHRGSSMNLGF
jgi:hypothetical protein